MQSVQALPGDFEHRPLPAAKQSAIPNCSAASPRATNWRCAVLFARHNVRVYRFVLRIVGDEALAEDLVNEVFVDVWRNAGRFEGNSQVSTWILASRGSRRCLRFAGARMTRSMTPRRKQSRIPPTIRKSPLQKTGPRRHPARVHEPSVARSSRDHRPRLLPRQVRGRSRRDRRRPEQHREDAVFHARKRMSELLRAGRR